MGPGEGIRGLEGEILGSAGGDLGHGGGIQGLGGKMMGSGGGYWGLEGRSGTSRGEIGSWR